MAVDLKRMAAVAVESAFNGDEPAQPERSAPRHRAGGGLRAVVAGAALVAAARFAKKHTPSPAALAEHLPDLSEVSDHVRDLLDDWFGDDEQHDEPEADAVDDEEDVDEEEEDEDVDDEEPEDEEPEDYEDEEEEEPEAYEDEDEELEPSERIDPASRPPKPPKRRKAKAG